VRDREGRRERERESERKRYRERGAPKLIIQLQKL
jgi:hypothetical protein